MTVRIVLLALLPLLACGGSSDASKTPAPAPTAKAPVEAPKPAAPAAPKPDKEKTVVDVALGSPDHTTLVAALKAGDLVTTLSSPGGIYTVFAPTNAAFAALPPGTVDGLLKPEKKPDLRKVLQHHACVPIIATKDMTDGQQVAMADGTKVTFHVKDGKYMVNDANILASVSAVNGIVHVVDKVLVP